MRQSNRETDHPRPFVRRAEIEELSPEGIIQLFSQLMSIEVAERRSGDLATEPLRSHYDELFTRGDRILPLRVLGYTQRLAPVLEYLGTMPETSFILDAGSGYGTESLLFSLTGKRVVGVELVPERVDLARSRMAYYQSICDFPLLLEFVNANVFRFLKASDPFDFIWAMEAVSHIYPPDDFFQLAFDSLKPGGRFAVSDPNSLNPLAWARSVRIRGSIKHTPHRRFKDPETGVPVDYGQERVFPIFELKRRLARAGFVIEHSSVSGFLCTSLLPTSFITSRPAFTLLSYVQTVAKKIPIVKWLGSNCLVVAQKPL